MRLVSSVTYMGQSTLVGADYADNKPPVDLALAREKLDMEPGRFCVLPVGQTMVVE